MKTYRGLYNKMLEPDVVAQCALDAAEDKLRRREVIHAFVNFDKTYNLVVKCAADPS